MNRWSATLRAGTVEPTNRLRLVLFGLPSDGGHVRISTFIAEIQLLYSTLRTLDKSLSATRAIATDYRITDLRHSSPALVEVEAVPRKVDQDRARDVVGSFLSLLYGVEKQSIPVGGVDFDALENIKGMTAPIGKTLLGLEVSANGYTFDLDREFRGKIAMLTRIEEEYSGSIRGVIEAINVHDDANEFRIYPDVGPVKVVCSFPRELKTEALAAVGRFVLLTGVLKRKQSARYPHAMTVSKLTVPPSDDEIPSLMALRGALPEITGDLSSLEYVRRLRDGET